MRLAGVIEESVVDGPGIRFVLFAQGCPHHCSGCHNPETWDTAGGQLYTRKEVLKLIKKKRKHLRGVTFSGGEPFHQAEDLSLLGQDIRELGLDVVTYTGYLYEDLHRLELTGIQELLEVTDILVDGPFMLGKRDISLAFRGSANQRIIDVPVSRSLGRVVPFVV